jgi:hypothetical protein
VSDRIENATKQKDDRQREGRVTACAEPMVEPFEIAELVGVDHDQSSLPVKDRQPRSYDAKGVPPHIVGRVRH